MFLGKNYAIIKGIETNFFQSLFMKMSKTLFILFSSYLLSIIFLIGFFGRIIQTNKTDTNPISFSHVLINS